MGKANRLTLRDLKENASARGGKYLSDFAAKSDEKALWECAKGHTWLASPRQIRFAKTWCPVCSGRAHNDEHRQIILRELQTLAASRGGRCLSAKYVSARSNMTWECVEGHRWEAPSDRIKNTGTWCAKCIGKGLKLTSEYQAEKLKSLQIVASSRGGRLISAEYLGMNKSLEWECAAGHRWEVKPAHVVGKTQSWCGQCNQTYSEKLIRLAFEAVFNVPFPNIRPDFLRSTRGRNLELDGYNSDLMLAFEFDGAQHFQKTRFQDSDQILNDVIQRDTVKDELSKAASLTLLRFNYREDVRDIPSLIKSKVPASRPDLLSYDFTVKPDYRSAYFPVDPADELRAIAKSRGGRLISTMYVNSDTKLEWEFSEGHRWFQKPDHIKNTGTWCRRCAVKASWAKRRR